MKNEYRFRLFDIDGPLMILRNNLREGVMRMNWQQPNALRITVASALGIKPEDFSTEYFNPNTLDRFARFFAVPRGPDLSWRWPTQDETAWAIQNFINRRAEPWAFFTNKMHAEQMITGDDATDLAPSVTADA